MKKIFTIITFCFFSFGINASESSNIIKPTSLSVNEQICSSNECYTITEKLGEGVFGQVFAVENSRGEQFALKSYKIHEDPNLANFLYTDSEREFFRGQTLDHPHIIKSIDFFTYEHTSNLTTQNLILELVKGQTVFETAKGILIEQAINNAIELSNALKYALSLGYMHLDLHGGNIMIDNNSKVKVIDLASFFTFEEIIFGFELYHSELEAITSTDPEKNSEILNAQVAKRQKNLNATEVAHFKKLKKIFIENPKLLKCLENAKAAFEKLTITNRFASKASLTPSSELNPDMTEHYRNSISLYYFNMVTDACIRFLSKTDLERVLKLNLRAEIKKIAWEYEEDIEDNCNLPIDHYFDNLFQFLHTKPISNI